MGTPEEIYQRPASIFVADFIGRANFVETQIIDCSNGCATLMLFGKKVQLPCSPQVQTNHAAYAVIRPEAIRLADSSSEVTGEVKSVVYFGSQVEYEVETEFHSLLVVDNDPQPGRIFHKGNQVSLFVDPLRSYVLPREKRELG